MSKTILFDIDKTLFNTPRFTEDLLTRVDEFLKSKGILKISGEELFNRYIYGLDQVSHFRIEELIRFSLKQLAQFNLSKEELNRLRELILYHLEKDYLYPDVLPTLKKLAGQGYALGIFSQSHDRTFQEGKIRPIYRYFEPELIFISQAKAEPEFLTKLPLKATIIDDKPEVVTALSEFAKKHDRDWQLYLIDRHKLVKAEVQAKLERLGVKNVFDLSGIEL